MTEEPDKSIVQRYLDYTDLTEADIKNLVENHSDKVIIAIVKGSLIPLASATIRYPSPENRKLFELACKLAWNTMHHSFSKTKSTSPTIEE